MSYYGNAIRCDKCNVGYIAWVDKDNIDSIDNIHSWLLNHGCIALDAPRS